MKLTQVRETAFAMPLTSPAFPMGPYRFINREYLIITYRTDPEALRAVVPEPMEIDPRALVSYEFIRMPDSTGFGDYTESGQVIPVIFEGKPAAYTHAMYLDDHPPTAGGRELWGFPKKLAQPSLKTHSDTLVGRLNYGPVEVAAGMMGYKHRALDIAAEQKRLVDGRNSWKLPSIGVSLSMPATSGRSMRPATVQRGRNAAGFEVRSHHKPMMRSAARGAGFSLPVARRCNIPTGKPIRSASALPVISRYAKSSNTLCQSIDVLMTARRRTRSDPVLPARTHEPARRRPPPMPACLARPRQSSRTRPPRQPDATTQRLHSKR